MEKFFFLVLLISEPASQGGCNGHNWATIPQLSLTRLVCVRAEPGRRFPRALKGMLCKAGPHLFRRPFRWAPTSPTSLRGMWVRQVFTHPSDCGHAPGRGKCLVCRDRSPKPQRANGPGWDPGPKDPVVLPPDHVTGFAGHKV